MIIDYLGHLLVHPLFSVGALLFIGFLIGKLILLIRLPEITGYIIAGLILGESVTGFISHEMGEELQLITEVALGMIALSIGGEFAWKKLKRLGVNISAMTLMQLVASFGVVAAALTLFRVTLPLALLMGAVASATAPAATVAIVQSLRAKGEFVDYLYGIVALDDAGAVILFGVMMALAVGISNMSEGFSQGAVIAGAIGEVFFSIVLGVMIGFLIHIVTIRQKNEGGILITALGLLLLNTAIASVFHFSSLLANMAAGATLINVTRTNQRIFRAMQPLTPPIYALFFVIAGTELQLGVILRGEVLLLGLVYIVGRAIGKYGGVFLGAAIVRANVGIRNWLGICMLPQAGVALGLVLIIQNSPLVTDAGPGTAQMVGILVNVVLMSVLVNELIGPPLSRFAILRGTGGNN